MSFWWLQPGWRDARCSCGATIWPEGDPDWGACFDCFSQQQHYAELEAAYYRDMEAAYERDISAKDPSHDH